MTYFDFYELPVSFKIDAAALKKTFYANSKRFHPDFFTLESDEKQAETLELSTRNTEAYKTLSDFDRRMKYVLELKGVLAAEGENKLPQDFLMDMMDINEALMELEFDPDAAAVSELKTKVQAIGNQLFAEIKPIVDQADASDTPQYDLEKVKNFYLKKRYLLRIFENLSKFAPL